MGKTKPNQKTKKPKKIFLKKVMKMYKIKTKLKKITNRGFLKNVQNNDFFNWVIIKKIA